MGCYINPPDMSKELWLVLHSEETLPAGEPGPITPTHVPVCWVDNGDFSAAAVAYSPAEVERFSHPSPDDHRLRGWFQVPRAAVRTVSNLAEYET